MKTSEILLLLQARAFRFNSQLGQNFLADDSVLEEILQTAQIQPGDKVLEIGAGAGCLTNALAAAGAQVCAVEFDEKLIAVLHTVLQGYKSVHIVHGDALRLPLETLCSEQLGEGPYKLVSNLPYGITTPLLTKLLRGSLPLSTLTVMVQAEAADRILSQPGTKAYGPLPVWTAYRTLAKTAFSVPAHCFVPQPHVDSVVLHMEMRENPPVSVGSENTFLRLVDAAFAMRRKTLQNNLCAAFHVSKDTAAAWIAACGLPSSVRGETLSLEIFAKLSSLIVENA